MLTTSVAVSGCTWNEELARAQAIQRQLLARDPRLVANADCTAVCRQMHAVGGDFYDFLALPNGDLGIAIGDVAGKGLGAALLMANLQATLRAEARRPPGDLTDVIATVNDQFHEVCFEEGYATLFYATFDPATRVFRYVNAGHNPPLVRRADSRIEWLETGGAPVGMFRSWSYSEGSVKLEPSDMLVAYTDGVVEAQNVVGEEWGAGRLPQILEEACGETATQVNDRIWKEVDWFSAKTEQRDDMTLLVLQVQ